LKQAREYSKAPRRTAFKGPGIHAILAAMQPIAERLPPRLVPFWRRLQYLLARFRLDRCKDTAAALTYMSLFALVPLLTVLYTMASAVPAFQGLEESIQDLLFENLVPETSADIEQYLEDFSQQAKNLTGFGLAFIGATAILMLRNIEMTFNRIWRTQDNRSPVSSFLLYWAVLSLAPLTLGLALGISAYLASFAAYFESVDVIGAGSALLRLAPILLSAIGFTLVYAAVPNCRVPLRHAFVGGLAAAVVFNVARALFTSLVAGSSITFIYGAFAAVPLFLLWIFISWNIVLLGAILVHSLSAYESSDQAARPTVLKALEVLHLLWQRQLSGRSLREIDLLTDRSHGIDSETWGRLRDLLLKHRIITRDDDGHYILARDLHTVTLWQIHDLVRGEPPVSGQLVGNAQDWERRAIEVLQQTEMHDRQALDHNLAELFAT
jgi:membrane protein